MTASQTCSKNDGLVAVLGAPSGVVVRPAGLEGVFVIQSQAREDARGYFARTWCAKEFEQARLNTAWVQQNQTFTKGLGSVRGMHWQAYPRPEIKLVRCLRGRVLDVVVDVRRGSASFGRWFAMELSQENMSALYIPEGFAHGFQCLEDGCELLYLMSEYYDPSLARGLRFDDPEVGIKWPLPAVNLSERDSTLPFLTEIV